MEDQLVDDATIACNDDQAGGYSTDESTSTIASAGPPASCCDDQQRYFDPTEITTSLPLLPFHNQVGGHASFFRFSRRAICKPVSRKEQEFYEHLEAHHPQLLPFTPQYMGVLNVTYRAVPSDQEDMSDGRAKSNEQPQSLLPEVVFEKNKHLLRDWRACHDKRHHNHPRNQRRGSSPATSSSLRSTPIKGTRDRLQLSPDDPNACAARCRRFQEQVLREVFSPDALRERLRQVHDWQQQRKRNSRRVCYSPGSRPSSPASHLQEQHSSSVPLSHSLSDILYHPKYDRDTDTADADADAVDKYHRSHPSGASYSEGGHSAPSMTINPVNPRTSSPPVTPLETPPIDHVMMETRRLSIIQTTTSAPLTPQIRAISRTRKGSVDLINPERGWPMEDDDDVQEQDQQSLLQQPLQQRQGQQGQEEQPSTTMTQGLDDAIFEMEDLVETTERPFTLTKSPSEMALPDLKKVTSRPVATSQKLVPSSTPADWKAREVPNNPWSLQVYNRDLQKMQRKETAQVKQFILIEDLTDGVKYPCVLDLKMGTRQYGVNVTPEKAKSQTIKCETSTSKALGVRVCGMQVYKTDKNKFLFQDKYYGRRLDPFSFRDTLAEYLDNGQGCQIQHIPVVVRKLRRLARIVRSLEDYRFYASSLLMIYDGDPLSQRKIDVRIIDFARCVTQDDVHQNRESFSFPPLHKGPDYGYLVGLKSLISCFEWIYDKHGGALQDLEVHKDDVFDSIGTEESFEAQAMAFGKTKTPSS